MKLPKAAQQKYRRMLLYVEYILFCLKKDLCPDLGESEMLITQDQRIRRLELLGLSGHNAKQARELENLNRLFQQSEDHEEALQAATKRGAEGVLGPKKD